MASPTQRTSALPSALPYTRTVVGGPKAARRDRDAEALRTSAARGEGACEILHHRDRCSAIALGAALFASSEEEETQLFFLPPLF